MPGYSIGKYPITVGQYRHFVETNGYRKSHYWTGQSWAWKEKISEDKPEGWSDKSWAGDDRLPVVGISWYEAYAYSAWLAEVTGRSGNRVFRGGSWYSDQNFARAAYRGYRDPGSRGLDFGFRVCIPAQAR